MTTPTVLLICAAAIVAFCLSFYQYFFKAGKKSKVLFFLASLRFITLLAVFVLLINPVITTKDFETVKTPLPVLLDNSASIKSLGQDSISKAISDRIKSNSKIKDKYEVQVFSFDDKFETGTKPDFTGKQTHIDNAAQNLKQLYRNTAYPVILLSDGNQTMGNDYVYSFQENTTVYPVILGDTTTFLDLRVGQVNANKYAFLKNKFPVEVFLEYNGNKNVNAIFTVVQGNGTLYKQNVTFSKDKKSQAISVLLNADKAGVQSYRAIVSSAENEKNKYNNIKNFAVEVIDQRSEIALVSAINHPDLGAIKRAIETNKQRRVTIVKPGAVKSLQDYNVLLLYQPDATFRQLLEANKSAGLNTFIITGNSTDFNLLNQYHDALVFKMSSQREDYLADYNPQFNLFAQENIGFEQFPPLQHPFGTIVAKSGASVLLQARIRNVKTDNPLLVFTEKGVQRQAFLLGENIWKWRIENHLANKSFEQFDIFTDKIVQYLAVNSKRKSLVVNHESFYNSGEAIVITAQYFNKNYEFDENALLSIALKNKETNAVKNYDFLRGGSEFSVNLDGMQAGSYSFIVKEKNSGTSYTGNFEILDFEIEKQFINPDLTKLEQTASNTGGTTYYPDNIDKLIQNLIDNEAYKPVQKQLTRHIPLINWVWVLVIISICLAAEWFVRKYNGLL